MANKNEVVNAKTAERITTPDYRTSEKVNAVGEQFLARAEDSAAE